MGTHPIFESDFDCLTETINTTKQRHVRLRDYLHEQARPDQGLGTREASHSQCSAYGNGRNVETHVWRCEQQNEHGTSRKTGSRNRGVETQECWHESWQTDPKRSQRQRHDAKGAGHQNLRKAPSHQRVRAGQGPPQQYHHEQNRKSPRNETPWQGQRNAVECTEAKEIKNNAHNFIFNLISHTHLNLTE